MFAKLSKRERMTNEASEAVDSTASIEAALIRFDGQEICFGGGICCAEGGLLKDDRLRQTSRNHIFRPPLGRLSGRRGAQARFVCWSANVEAMNPLQRCRRGKVDLCMNSNPELSLEPAGA